MAKIPGQAWQLAHAIGHAGNNVRSWCGHFKTHSLQGHKDPPRTLYMWQRAGFRMRSRVHVISGALAGRIIVARGLRGGFNLLAERNRAPDITVQPRAARHVAGRIQ